MASTHFSLPGLEKVVTKIIPNHNGTITVFLLIKGVEREVIVPHVDGQFDTTSLKIITAHTTLVNAIP